MTVHAWRMVKARHAAAAFSGTGARKFGGRWNSPGVAVIYLSGSVALAMLETLVHLEADELLKHYVLVEVSFDEPLMTILTPSSLPGNWRKSPPPLSTQKIGDRWVARAQSPILKVPSTIVPAESNYLLNPVHPDFTKIRIGRRQPIQFDPRLLKPRA